MIYCNCSFFRACGTVYIARDNETDEVVAIKIVSLQQDQKQLGLIVKEIEALTTLEHNNIINYRGSYRINQTLWIVMDYLEGMILQSNRGNWTQLKLANAVRVYIYIYIYIPIKIHWCWELLLRSQRAGNYYYICTKNIKGESFNN